MATTLFIRTCVKDFEWLEYCFRSIDKYASGVKEGVVGISVSDLGKVPEEWKDRYRWVETEDDLDNGYIIQQMVKLYADIYCPGADSIFYMDSDCVFTEPVSPEDYFIDGKPRMLYTPYTELPRHVPWQDITSRVLGWYPDDEYMRQHPLILSVETLKDFREWYEKRFARTLCEGLKRLREFSEFNAIGAWASKYRKDSYVWVRVPDNPDAPPGKVLQEWSWGGLTPEIREKLEKICA
jgi:hypothetical protein